MKIVTLVQAAILVLLLVIGAQGGDDRAARCPVSQDFDTCRTAPEPDLPDA